MRESTSSLTNNNTKYTEMASKTSIDTNNTKKALNLMTNIQEGALIHLCLNPGFELQLLTINFVGFGRHAGFRFHTRRQSFETSYTQIQALLVFFFSIAFSKKERMNKSIGLLKTFEVSRFYQLQILPSSNLPQLPLGVQCRSFHPLFLLIASLKSWSAQGPLKWIVSGSTRVILSIKYQHYVYCY